MAAGWRGELVEDDPDVPDGGETTASVAFYCPQCWEREFGSRGGETAA